MRGGALFQLLLRALPLAAMGFFLSLGTASAHQGHHHDVSTAIAAPSTGVAAAAAQASEVAVHLPCSGSEDGCPGGDCCCAVACHAALAALPVGPLVGPDRPGLALLDRSEPLTGLAGDRMDRPPKRI